MRWQIILPFILAAFLISCASNAATVAQNANISALLTNAKEWRHTPYKLGGTSKKRGADCSFFTQSMYESSFNIALKRSSTEQLKGGKKISKQHLKAGDLVFFKAKGPNGLHVGIYLKDRLFLHLSAKGGAKISNIDDSYWRRRFLTARRYQNVR